MIDITKTILYKFTRKVIQEFEEDYKKAVEEMFDKADKENK